jgi:hypothetical protein
MVNKKAQGWSLDLVIASIIFTAGILTFYIYIAAQPIKADAYLTPLTKTGNLIANDLMSLGLPLDWEIKSQSEFVKLGILSSDKRIDPVKLQTLFDLANNPDGTLEPIGYQLSKTLFNTRYNYWISLSVPFEDGLTGISGIGSDPPDTAQNLIKITRFTIYKDKPVTLDIRVWE